MLCAPFAARAPARQVRVKVTVVGDLTGIFCSIRQIKLLIHLGLKIDLKWFANDLDKCRIYYLWQSLFLPPLTLIYYV